MREIKFRAKSKYSKEWVYGTGIVQVLHNTYKTDEYEMVKEVNYDELDYFRPLYETEEIDIKTLGQYTGLKDINGKEIYEGDIVNGRPDSLEHDILREVEWVEDDGYIRCGYTPLCDNYYDCGLNYEEFEVIGNIYENKELLKK